MKIFGFKSTDKFMNGIIINDFIPYQLEFVNGNAIQTKILPVSDFFCVRSVNMKKLNFPSEFSMSERAFQILEPVLPQKNTRIHTLYYEKHKFYLFEPPVLKEGDWEWELNNDFEKEFPEVPNVFTIRSPYNFVNFTEKFVEAAQAAKLVGPGFHLNWSDSKA